MDKAHLTSMQSSYFFGEIVQILEEHSTIERTTAMSNSIQNWRGLLIATSDAFNELKKQVKDEKKLEELELSFGSFQLHALDALRNLEAACFCVTAGYSGPSFVLLRVAIERMLFGLYFIIDPASIDARRLGERLKVTGRGGIIGKLNDKEFVRTKMGWKEGTDIQIIDDEFAEAVTSFYRKYSEVVHGIAMEATDVLDIYVASKGNNEKGAKLLVERQKEYIKNVAIIAVNWFDLLANLYFFGVLLATKGQIVKEAKKNECFKDIATKFPRLNRLYSDLKTERPK